MSGGELAGISVLTLRVAGVATLLSLPLAVALGYALARFAFPGRTLLRAAVALPMVLPPVAVGLGLLLLLGRRGPLAGLWELTGIEIVFTWWAAVIAGAVVGFPLLVRTCEQSFFEIDPRFERLSRTLGLGRIATFWRVTLPMARRGIVYGSLLAFSRALGEFGATAVAAGIVEGRTETLALGIWSRVQTGRNGEALLLCAASFALALASLVLAEGWLARGRRPS